MERPQSMQRISQQEGRYLPHSLLPLEWDHTCTKVLPLEHLLEYVQQMIISHVVALGDLDKFMNLMDAGQYRLKWDVVVQLDVPDALLNAAQQAAAHAVLKDSLDNAAVPLL